jgi:hypothetical protein
MLDLVQLPLPIPNPSFKVLVVHAPGLTSVSILMLSDTAHGALKTLLLAFLANIASEFDTVEYSEGDIHSSEGCDGCP